MYHLAKKIAKTILPKSFLLNNEMLLRKLFSLKNRGNTYRCNVCDTGLKKFIQLDSGDHLCPVCGSRARSRRLYHLLLENQWLRGTILHFSPPRILYKKLKQLPEITYFATDYENEFTADYQYDITAIDCEDNTFDTIICYHVLEHISEDLKAMSELYRVLKPEGICLIQTPFKEGAIYEDDTIKTEEGRLEAFGQKDHVRIYSIESLQERLELSGFQVTVLQFTVAKDENHPHAWHTETILQATKY